MFLTIYCHVNQKFRYLLILSFWKKNDVANYQAFLKTHRKYSKTILTRFIKKIVLFENSNHKFRDKNIDKFLIKKRFRNFITNQQKKQIVISNNNDFIQSLNVLKSDEKNNKNAFFAFSNIFKILNKFSKKIAEKQRIIRFDRSISKTDFSIFFNFKIMQFFFCSFRQKNDFKKNSKIYCYFRHFRNQNQK